MSSVLNLEPDRYDEFVGRVAGALRRSGGHPSRASDALHDAIEAFLRLERAGGSVAPDRLGSWLASVAVNKDRERRRRERCPISLDDGDGIGERLASADPRVGRELERAEVRIVVRKAVADLPVHLERVVALAMSRVTQRVIAETLHVHPNTVRKRLRSALILLAEVLHEYRPCGGEVVPDGGRTVSRARRRGPRTRRGGPTARAAGSSSPPTAPVPGVAPGSRSERG